LGQYSLRKRYRSLKSKRRDIKLNKGMLLKDIEKGYKAFFTKEKAGLHGLTASDGSMYPGPLNRYVYRIAFGSKSPELVDLYSKYFEHIYGSRMQRDFDKGHPRAYISNKMAFQDLKKYNAKTGPDTWKVPRAYIDKEGAREWLKCFFSGDGTVKNARNATTYDILYESTDKEGIIGIRSLLFEEFEITSSLSIRYRKDRPGHKPFCALRVRDKIRFAKEIGSYKSEHIERLDEILKGMKR